MIAAVTNYYNPANKGSKLKNFIKFKARFPDVPLYVVEAAFGDEPFTLRDSENIIQVRCKDVIWQQYTLVNLGINRLPDKYDKAVWIDADILVEDDWAHKVDEALDQFKIVQSFNEVAMLSKGLESGEVRRGVASVALDNAKLPHNSKLSSCLDLNHIYASGFSWGVQRDVIDKYRVYDYWITGSCDTAFCIGIWGDWENSFFNRLNERMRSHYMEWAIPFHEYVGGSVGCVDSRIKHLWHGHRNYKKRWNCLKNFDPYVDIKLNDGVLEWCGDNTDLQECCKLMCENYEIDFNPYL